MRNDAEAEAFVVGLSREDQLRLHSAIVSAHRYTQGTVISVLCRVLYLIGKSNTGTDGRNEHAIRLCQTLAKISDTGECGEAEIAVIRSFFF